MRLGFNDCSVNSQTTAPMLIISTAYDHWTDNHARLYLGSLFRVTLL